MKLRGFICILTILFMFPVVADNCSKKHSVIITQLTGKAHISTDEKKWTAATKKMDVAQSSFIKTAKKASLILTFADGSTLRVGEESKINLTELLTNPKCERNSYKIKVFFGKIWSKVKKAVTNKDDNFLVESKNAVAGVRGTSFGFIVNPDESGAVMVLTGKIAVKEPKQKKPEKFDIQAWKKNRSRKQVAGPKQISKKKWETLILNAMQQVTFSKDGTFSKPTPIGSHNAGSWFKQNAE